MKNGDNMKTVKLTRTKVLLEQVDKENAELKLELYNQQEYEEDYEEEDDYDM